jgi:coproporphyrinogen III oxidase-like Fe-S oxidoreductase
MRRNAAKIRNVNLLFIFGLQLYINGGTMQGIKGKRPSLYIHIPFCARKCAYCDFYSVVYDKGRAEAYVDVICRQVNRIDEPVSTIFIGGGTPTVLESSGWQAAGASGSFRGDAGNLPWRLT